MKLSRPPEHNVEITNAMVPKPIPVGTVFTRLTVVRVGPFHLRSDGLRDSTSVCQCSCGKEKVIPNHALRKGYTKSCGCLAIEALQINSSPKHGHCRRQMRSKTYCCWRGMIKRCIYPKDKRFHHYGGRGISVCDKWRHSFAAFLSDLGECPPGLTLERLNNSKGYEPGNCVWATRTVQNRNKRTNRILTVRGVTACFSELCLLFQVPEHRVRSRLKRGWSVERAFFTPRI